MDLWGLVVDGRPMTPVSSPPKATWRLRGPWSAEWSMLPGDHGIGPRSAVDWWRNGRRVWRGRILDRDPRSGTYVAAGWCREAEQWPSVNASRAGIWPGDAASGVTWAIAEGLPWAGHLIPAQSHPPDMLTLAAALDRLAGDQGQWWTLDDNLIVRLVDVQTKPRWVLPVDARIKPTGEGWPTRAIAKYQQTTPAPLDESPWALATRGVATINEYGHQWAQFDLTDRGPLAPSSPPGSGLPDGAREIAGKRLRRISKPAPAGDLGLLGLLSFGLTTADPSGVAPGDVIRLRSTVDAGTEIDLTIGTVAHDAGRWTVTPLGSPARGFRRVAEQFAANR